MVDLNMLKKKLSYRVVPEKNGDVTRKNSKVLGPIVPAAYGHADAQFSRANGPV